MAAAARTALRVGRGVLATVVAAALAGCTPAPDADAGPSRMPVAVDTDLGADDVLALLYLLGRDDVEVVAVTVSGNGLVRCPAGGRNARAVLAAAGRPDVPVACGTDRPLSGRTAFPAQWRDQADGLYGMAARWPTPAGPPPGTDPVDLLAGALRDRPGLRVLALGPLTTVALALREPGTAGAQVVVSGGAVSEPGNMPARAGPPLAEWNVGVDPAAAAEVLESGRAELWVTLDATNDVPADVWFAAALASMRRDRAGDAASAFLAANPGLSRGGYFYWDPVAAAALTDPSIVAARMVPLSVTVDGDSPGRTVERPGGTDVRVTTRADPVAFADAALAAFGPAGAPPPRYRPGTPPIRVRAEPGAFHLTAPAVLPAGDAAIGFAASAAGYVVAVGRPAGGHGYDDVVAAVRAGVTAVPPWFVVEAYVEVPPGSAPTWVVALPAGEHAFVAADADGTATTALGVVITR